MPFCGCVAFLLKQSLKIADRITSPARHCPAVYIELGIF